MKASEITQPGLYWCRFTNGRCEPVEVFWPSPDGYTLKPDRLYFGRLSHDDGWTWDGLHEDMATGDFIGPFPPPGEGPKFEGFKAALEALCDAYDVALNTDSDGRLEVWDGGHTDLPGIKDKTLEGRLQRTEGAIKG